MNAFAPRSPPVLTALLGCLALAALLAAAPGRAGDEDMSTSAYLVFDPETGEFVTVDDPNRTRQHAAEQPVAEPAGGGQGSAGSQPAGPSLPAFAAAGVGVVLAGAAAVAWLRRRQPKKD